MSQLPLFVPPAMTLTVSDLTRYLRELLEADPTLQDVWVQGEVSNSSRPSSGHYYFTLKDSGASLRCVMWRAILGRQTFSPRDGDAVEVHGYISVYDAGGQYQLYADAFRPLGEGALFQEFLRLKAQLEAEGLFDPARKRPIPQWPHRIGIVTSPTGAALRDMLNTLRRRYPLVEVVLAPTPVQGDEAPAGIVAALQGLNRVAAPDVILVARGGGSLEDLWPFNSEQVARAIAASAAPVISGVGHETDFTIADFVADLRAPTPTAAAELATPDREELRSAFDEAEQRLGRSIQSSLQQLRWNLADIKNRLGIHSPRARLLSDRQRVDELERRAEAALLHGLQMKRARLEGFQQHIASLNPLAVLQRGYAIVSSPEGELVYRVAQAEVGKTLSVRVSDGQFGAEVTTPKPTRHRSNNLSNEGKP